MILARRFFINKSDRVHKVPKECDRITSVVVTNIRRKKVFHGLFLDPWAQSGGLTFVASRNWKRLKYS